MIAIHVRVGAVPARREWMTVTQSDGSSLRVRLCGDENAHFYLTEDGVPLVREADGDFCYATAIGFALASSGVTAHDSLGRSPEELRHVATATAAAEVAARSPRRSVAVGRHAVRGLAARRSAYVGERRGLVIMVNFPDRDFIDDDAYSDWDAILNEEGFSENGANGSVSDYFRDQSRGLFDISFDLVGPVTASRSRYYYGANDSWDIDIDLNMDELVIEACEAVRGQVDFSDYDWDGDGYVEQVFILYAGGGEAYTGADSRLIWPHEYYLSAYGDYPLGYEIDGVYIDTYACSSELAGLESAANPQLSGLGTFCHEFSHCLGLPDLYTYVGLDMLGSWDLLSEGCYNADGWCPPEYTAYEKMACGWVEPETLDAPADVDGLLPMSMGGGCYLVRNDCDDEGVDEYYMLENRQRSGWDAYIPGSGLTIMHVDYDEYKWYYNIVNDDRSHPGVAIIPAGNRYVADSSIAYPYNGNDSLTDSSTPAAIVYNANVQGTLLMGKPITCITHDKDEGTVSFRFMGGAVAEGIDAVSASSAAEGFAGGAAYIYDLDGRRVARVGRYDGLPDSLPPGVYVVKGDDGTCLKVAKR